MVSHLNITQARTKYGGTYECRASSKVCFFVTLTQPLTLYLSLNFQVGSVSHAGKLNVHGAPFVRRMKPMKVGMQNDGMLYVVMLYVVKWYSALDKDWPPKSTVILLLQANNRSLYGQFLDTHFTLQ